MDEELTADEQPTVQRISRRKALKRIGVAGAAAAWSAPLISSLRTPAFAQASPRCAEPCDATCATSFPGCGLNCFCSRAENDACFCWQNDFCANLTDAGADGSCPAGQTAVSTCCDQGAGFAIKCFQPCGATTSLRAPQRVTSGPRAAGG